MLDTLILPQRDVIQSHVLRSLERYWPSRSEALISLPLKVYSESLNIQLPLQLVPVRLPSWAKQCGVDEVLLIPQEVIPKERSIKEADLWQDIDWFLASFLLLEAWHERTWEVLHGPIHSYSSRLKGWDERVWQHAWVNRIALFLREWTAHCQGFSVEDLFGALPNTEILMTHDVDAVEKTLSIRLKQGAFTGLNSVRAILRGDLNEGRALGSKAVRLLVGREDWWKFDELRAAEKFAGITSIFHFYADERPKSPKRWLFDPGYDLKAPRVQRLIKRLQDDQHQIGLHPSYESWKESDAIERQKNLLEEVVGSPVTACRQHWLRFSWRGTWTAQESAGLRSDTTLMFNDRSGFRNASAMRWHPWNAMDKRAYKLEAQPSVLMDSHLYDYHRLSDLERQQQIRAWLGECYAVHGQVAVLWHPHTLTDDYGWEQGFKVLLHTITEMKTK